MRRKSGKWLLWLLVLTLLWGSIPAAYAAGHSITIHAPEGNGLPYWEFEKAGVESADVRYLTAGESHGLPAGRVSRVSLAVGKGKDGEASCGISVNGMYYVQSVTLEHPDFFTGTVEIQIGRDAQWSEETWGNITPVEDSNILGRVQFKDGTFTDDVTISVTPMTQQQADAAQKQNQRQVVPQGKYTVAQISEAIQGIMAQKRSALGLSETDNLLSGDELTYAGSSATDWLPIGLSRCGVEDDYDSYLAALQTYVEQKYREPDKLDRVKATEWHRISLSVLACGGDPTHFGKDADGNDINLIADGVYDRGKTVDIGAQGLNGWLWGLITLDSMKYNIPAGSSYTRTEMIKKILSFQLPDDGFNLRFAQGSTADPDITAMAIQALAPYYRNATFNVKDPVDKALDCLSKLQLDTGDFRSWGTRNSESVSQIIVSLCSIGVDPQNDSRFIKNGINAAVAAGLSVSVNTPLCSLNTAYDETLRFVHGLGVRYVTCSGLIPSGGAVGDESRATALTEQQLTDVLTKAVAVTEELEIELDFTSPGWLKEETLRALGLTLVPSCGACLSNMAIAPDGGVIPCQSWLSSQPLGNILADDWDKIWQSERCAAIRAKSARMEQLCQLRESNREEGTLC